MKVRECGKSWFLAQIKPNCARVAEKNLAQQGFATFLPMQEQTRQTASRFITTLRPLFPGYIFVRFDTAKGLWRKVNSTYGITRLVSLRGTPTAVPDEVVSELMVRCDDQGKLVPIADFAPGDRVSVNKGPFADFVAEVETVCPDQRVWLLMEIMGGQTRVAVDANQLRAG
ncbi:transcription termination/antitermination protein NusG [Shimia sp. FJ5]|uniref:transcription termination/antitermination protein NusG n=1 Tax=Shimia sp. FJ5 TaxID=3079054 RepID=UPI0026075C25|nr:transcriptional activator RfaH [Shimia sp. FJ5]MDV4144311.1 transcriptional activator RfaH [Shimia sp. FJ5]